MSPRAAAWLAWSLAGLSVAMFLASVALTIMSLYGAPATEPPSTWGTGVPKPWRKRLHLKAPPNL
jgi:hypothetical protein